ncbi:unnamed protein product [Mesocestoides corti]|uniref:Autophagy-related protein 101 n=1 Tax=Mesocestoides corti TaxID=53468 RepID=A0A3P6GWU5_MESCO|nr:unnamed protein product [Mesocestoides corti]
MQISDLEEVLVALFHTITFHRTFPTLTFKDGAVSYTSYIGTEDVDCRNVDLTYVRVASKAVHERIAGQVALFSKALHDEAKNSSDKSTRGSIALAFVINRKGNWVLGSEPSAWERWTVNIEVQPPSIDNGHHRQRLSSQLKGEMLYVLDCINTSESYLPELGCSQTDCDHVIDFSMPEVSPYRFVLSYITGKKQSPQGKTAGLRRL